MKFPFEVDLDRKAVKKLVRDALREDLGAGDVTTDSTPDTSSDTATDTGADTGTNSRCVVEMDCRPGPASMIFSMPSHCRRVNPKGEKSS